MPNITTAVPNTQLDMLLTVCRELTDHLSAYAISAGNFDDEAFATCVKAETVLFDARRFLSPSKGPDELLSDCCGRVIEEINDYPVCPGCGAIC